MKNFDLNTYGVVGMNNSEMENVDGGNPLNPVALPVILIIVAIAVAQSV